MNTTQTQVRSTEEALSVFDTLKLALEALENILKHDGGEGSKCYSAIRLFDAREVGYKAITAIKEALMSDTDGAQPEPWEKFCDLNCVWTDHHPDCKLAQRLPLTDEEIILIVAECAASHQHTDIHFARAIERAHGIKELV